MELYTLLREFADSWALLALTVPRSERMIGALALLVFCLPLVAIRLRSAFADDR